MRASWRIACAMPLGPLGLPVVASTVAAVPAGAVTCPGKNLDLSGGRNYSGVDWTGCNLSGDNFNYDNLSSATLHGVNLTNASLFDVNFSSSDLSGANLTGAVVSFAQFGTSNLANSTTHDLNEYYGGPTSLPTG